MIARLVLASIHTPHPILSTPGRRVTAPVEGPRRDNGSDRGAMRDAHQLFVAPLPAFAADPVVQRLLAHRAVDPPHPAILVVVDHEGEVIALPPMRTEQCP